MKANNKAITGVLHQAKTKVNYDLRRYFPEGNLTSLVEQYWFVDWSLEGGKTHTQQNLPDPNFHLVFEKGKARLVGPVSKVYQYTMKEKGKIFGVKFRVGALVKWLGCPVVEYIDQERGASEVFGIEVEALALELTSTHNDEQAFAKIQTFLSPFVIEPSPSIDALEQHLSLIKDNIDITRVKQLSEYTNTSVRSLQRNFSYYLGFSPKWLIRKYRLHQALTKLEKAECDIAEIVEWLGYTDQSHLIKDFKELIGVTPNHYLRAGKS